MGWAPTLVRVPVACTLGAKVWLPMCRALSPRVRVPMVRGLWIMVWFLWVVDLGPGFSSFG